MIQISPPPPRIKSAFPSSGTTETELSFRSSAVTSERSPSASVFVVKGSTKIRLGALSDPCQADAGADSRQQASGSNHLNLGTCIFYESVRIYRDRSRRNAFWFTFSHPSVSISLSG